MLKRYRLHAALLGLMVLSALLYVLSQEHGGPAGTEDTLTRHYPEWITYNARIWQSASNAPEDSHYLQVRHAIHWPDDRRTELADPVGWAIKPEQLLYWQGRSGAMYPGALHLDDGVRLVLFRPDQRPLYLLTEHLRYHARESLLSTPEAATIRQGNLLLTGKILQYWFETQHLRINEEVLARYETPAH